MIPMLLACALSFLPTEPDTIVGIRCNKPGCSVLHEEEILRIIPTDSIRVSVPVWYIKRLEYRLQALEDRLQALENPPSDSPTRRMYIVPDTSAWRREK